MSTAFITPIPKELHHIFGEPEPGTYVYEQEGDFGKAQAWFWALRNIVGDVIALPSVSLFVPVSRNAIHKRIKQGKLSCFKFQILTEGENLSSSLKRERPHAFVPISEAQVWLQEYYGRQNESEGLAPVPTTAENLHMVIAMHHFGDDVLEYHETWKKTYEEFQKEYTKKAWKLTKEQNKRQRQQDEN